MLKAKLLGATAGAEAALAIEDVFSTYLFTGTGAALTINNGIDLAGEGGLVWQKSRTNAAYDHNLFDTARGVTKKLLTNTNLGEITETTYLTAFNANGFSVGSDAGYNQSGAGIVTWTFRQAPRFFDVVTYTGNGTAGRQIAHNLGVVPGCIIVKKTNATANWQVYHRSLANTQYLVLNLTNVVATGLGRWNSTTPTDTVFTLGADTTVNANGDTYVAYLFAHDPLGPSGDGSDGLIACGSYTGNGSNTGPVINLGWEPQWIMIRPTSISGDWVMFDNMRGVATGGIDPTLDANNSLDELVALNLIDLTATGFNVSSSRDEVNRSASPYIYIAIRRGPMREPTVGTEVFAMDTYRATSPALVSGFVTDWTFRRLKNTTAEWTVSSRLTGKTILLFNSTAAEASGTTELYDYQNGAISSIGSAFSTLAGWMFRRAPGFFDVVAYRGTGSTGTKNHNLGVVPEMMIFKNRNDTDPWIVYHQATGNTGYTPLNMTSGFLPASLAFNNTSPTATVFTVGSTLNFSSSFNYIAYLFASLPGISKVGSYTGNGSSQTINCAFTTGARFVLIKRTDTTGDWYVWDTARGIVSGNDPHLSLNTTAAEVTSDDTIDPDSTGFIVNQVAATNVNVSSASYIFYAVS